MRFQRALRLLAWRVCPDRSFGHPVDGHPFCFTCERIFRVIRFCLLGFVPPS